VKPRGRPRKVFIGDVVTESANNSTDVLLPSEDFRDELPLLGEAAFPGLVAEVYTSVTLRMPQALYDEYAKTAESQSMSVEEVMQHRLSKCKNHNTLRGLWFSDSERAQLENLLKKRPLETASQVLTTLNTVADVDLDGFKISLTLPQRKILNIRARNGRSPEQVFESMIRKEFQV
jgi:hypothetical protein